MNIATTLQEHARRFGDRSAIIERDRRVTFAELNRAAVAAAEDLSAAGLAAGMRALLFCPMSIDLYTAMIGLFRLGVTAVFVDPSAGSANLAACISRVRPEAFIAIPQAHLLRLTSAAVRAIPIKLAIGRSVPGARAVGRRSSDNTRQMHPCDDGTPAIITFTSGTTGAPKAAARTHGFLLAQHRALVESLGLDADGTDLTTLPIFLLANLASGLTSIIPDADLRSPGAIDPAPVLDQMRVERPTRTVASPALLEQLVARVTASGGRLDTLQKVFAGGAPVFPKTLDAIASVAPCASIVAVYGSTEAEPIASINRCDISPSDRLAMQQGAGLLTGKPASSIRLRILPDRWGHSIVARHSGDFERECLGAGCAGEIVVAGDHVLSGYLDGLGDEDTKFTVGDRVWHRTGDAGYFDAWGRLWLLGRCSAKVSDVHGVQYPLAVECAASDVPGVRRSAFVLHRGHRVLVVEADGITSPSPESLMRRLAWAHVSDVMTVSRIPVDRRHNAKIDAAVLHTMLQRGSACFARQP
jgi:acyl-CoA synthetase (AMP-forming)/AMP-acid ligase II